MKLFSRFSRGLVALAFLAFFVSPAVAEKRVALVIGNGGYKNVGKLANPLNDSQTVADLLKRTGFDVVDMRRDLSFNDMRHALSSFTDKVENADVAVIYYAGHGIEVDGINYLIPVDAELKRDDDVQYETLPLDRLLRALEPAKKLRLVILDACRDNPFARTMKRTIATRSIGRGLATVEPQATNTLIAFAAKAGSTAADGDGRNSPFTAALVKHLAEPGLDVRLAFGRVRDEVMNSTSKRQEPFVYGSLGGSIVALTPDPDAAMRRDYEFASQIGTKAAWDSFLATYQKGYFPDLARAARLKIVAAETAEAEAAKAKANAEAAERAMAANATSARANADTAKLIAEAAERARAEALEQARAEARKIQDAQDAQRTKVAALHATGEAQDVTRNLQSELRRVGCHLGAVDGNWTSASQRGLEQFNRFSGMQLEVKEARADTLEAVKAKSARICPLTCQRGFRAEGERCVAITCPTGQFLNSNGSCQERPAKAAARPETRQPAKSSAKEGQRDTPRRASDIPCDRGLGSRGGPNEC